jgi:excisionase family DNA binding protein
MVRVTPGGFGKGDMLETESPRDVETNAPTKRPKTDSARRTIRSIDDLAALLTVEEVSVILRTTRKAIYAMVERGQLPGVVRIGRRLLVRKRELLHWLDHTCTPSQEKKR